MDQQRPPQYDFRDTSSNARSTPDAMGQGQWVLQTGPVALFPNFIAPQRTELIMKYKMLGDSFDVTLASGALFLTCESASFSLSHRKNIIDPSGRHLFTIRKDTGFLRATTYWIETAPEPGQPDPINIWEMKDVLNWGGSTKFVAQWINSASGQKYELFMKLSWNGTEATISRGSEKDAGPTVATISREYFHLGREYKLTVEAGVDMALILAMCACLDDRKRSQSNAAAG